MYVATAVVINIVAKQIKLLDEDERENWTQKEEQISVLSQQERKASCKFTRKRLVNNISP